MKASTCPIRPIRASPAATMLALAASLLACTATARPVPDLDEAVAAMVRQTNELRRSQGLAPVKPEGALVATAREFAEYMARSDRYGHNVDGRAPAARAQAQGYGFCMVAENIAYQFYSGGFETADLAEGFVQGWAESPGHRRNMLDADATQTGVAVAQSRGKGGFYAVQMFGRPKGIAQRFSITNASSRGIRYELDGPPLELRPGGTRTFEYCGARTLTLHWPDGGGTRSLVPADGERWRIEGGGPAGWRVEPHRPR